MRVRNLAITVAIIGIAAFILSGVLKHDDSGFLGVLSAVSWLTFLICLLAVVVTGSIALLQHFRKEDKVQRT